MRYPVLFQRNELRKNSMSIRYHRIYSTSLPSHSYIFHCVQSWLSIMSVALDGNRARTRVSGRLSGTGWADSRDYKSEQSVVYVSLFQNAADFLARRIGRDRGSERSVINIHARHAGVHMCKSGSDIRHGSVETERRILPPSHFCASIHVSHAHGYTL